MKVEMNEDGGITITLKASGSKLMKDIMYLRKAVPARMTEKGKDGEMYSRFMDKLYKKIDETFIESE